MIVHRRIDRVQTGPLLGGRVRISHPYICQTRSAQAMRLCMTKYLTTTTEAARSKRQSATRSAGAAGGECGLGSRRDTRGPNQQCVGEDDWLEGECGLQANPRHRLEG